ncbi:hypothetical protein KGA66_22680 [Actinocrinis puniceicyclus]|uniref:Uncharacterized protein n=1 Tax=Actinocrinis puniceicyclus TaxID=977794 RepID=A0A8J8BD64_9ACTN|nr:hypothetical protein [Actinocrinis puniceicyclus]MBS2965872.1 hypothetical protein [Actinocrinis puniceicyclus]
MPRNHPDLDVMLREAATVHDSDLPAFPSALTTLLARETVSASCDAADFDGGETAARGRTAPATRARRRRVALGAALVAGTTLAVTLTQTLGAAAPVAFAGWQPVPTMLTGAAARQQFDACPYFKNKSFPPEIARRLALPPSFSPGQTLVEQRGRVAFIVFANGKVFGDCMLLDGRGDGGAIGNDVPQPSGADVVSNGGGASYTFDATGARVDIVSLAGRAGPEVSSVLIHRADGVVVTATVHDGLWAAWWPGTVLAAELTVYTRDGRSHDQPALASR